MLGSLGSSTFHSSTAPATSRPLRAQTIFLPEFPPPLYLTTRLDLGDVSKGNLVTIDNFEVLFKDALNPKQLEGLRLLVTPFPQQQFNQTADRRAVDDLRIYPAVPEELQEDADFRRHRREH